MYAFGTGLDGLDGVDIESSPMEWTRSFTFSSSLCCKVWRCFAGFGMDRGQGRGESQQMKLALVLPLSNLCTCLVFLALFNGFFNDFDMNRNFF